jgi:parallel beta-helix repeat protein
MSYPAYNGIVVERSNIVIDGNGYMVQGSCSDSGIGLNLMDVGNVTIEGANFEWFQKGILLSNSNNNTIIGNDATGNGVYPTGIFALGDEYGIALSNSSSNSIIGNYVEENGWDGICLSGSSNNIVRGNIAEYNKFNGIEIYNSYNIISGNTATGNTVNGIYVSGSGNTVSGNTATGQFCGIDVDSSFNGIVSGNMVAANGNGIWLLDASFGNIVSFNNVTTNSDGVVLYSNSSWNTVFGNNAIANGCGVHLWGASYNTLYHNNFINNTSQVVSDSSVNTWDNGYPSGGNFWSDYNGTDMYSGPYQNVTGSDGIGDTPYVIDANNTDYYPLMGMFSDFNVAQGVDVQAVSNSTVSDFQFNGTAMLFNVTGENGASGFCRISFPTDLINGTLTVFVNGTQMCYDLMSSSNSSITFVYFTYDPSTEQVTIMPEFPSFILLSLFLIATLLAVIIYKKKAMPHKRL